jgi:hypothetical protein
MKKILLVAALVTICSLSIAATANAAAVTISSGGTTIGGALFKPSTNVSLSVFTIATSYCSTALHGSSMGQSAGKEFGSTSGDAVIKSKSSEALTAIEACTDSVTLPTGML